ncbi:unnamed protein product, partial [Phaeothamnion confervicola]
AAAAAAAAKPEADRPLTVSEWQAARQTISNMQALLKTRQIGHRGDLSAALLELRQLLLRLPGAGLGSDAGKERHTAAADVLLQLAHTRNFAAATPYAPHTSDPVPVAARELGTRVPRSLLHKFLANGHSKTDFGTLAVNPADPPPGTVAAACGEESTADVGGGVGGQGDAWDGGAGDSESMNDGGGSDGTSAIAPSSGGPGPAPTAPGAVYGAAASMSLLAAPMVATIPEGAAATVALVPPVLAAAALVPPAVVAAAMVPPAVIALDSPAMRGAPRRAAMLLKAAPAWADDDLSEDESDSEVDGSDRWGPLPDSAAEIDKVCRAGHQEDPVGLWDTLARRRVSGRAAPRRRNLRAYLAKRPHMRLYNGQDGGKIRSSGRGNGGGGGSCGGSGGS